MKIFDKFNKDNRVIKTIKSEEYDLADKLGIKGYKNKEIKQCKKIWKELVPSQGQADSVQGELLREIEKLREEAQRNGNINWDDNFDFFCDNINNILKQSNIFDERELNNIKEIMYYLKLNGEYAYAYYTEGSINDNDYDPLKQAYVDDDIYDYICEKIAIFSFKNKNIIPYDKKENIYR